MLIPSIILTINLLILFLLLFFRKNNTLLNKVPALILLYPAISFSGNAVILSRSFFFSWSTSVFFAPLFFTYTRLFTGHRLRIARPYWTAAVAFFLFVIAHCTGYAQKQAATVGIISNKMNVAKEWYTHSPASSTYSNDAERQNDDSLRLLLDECRQLFGADKPLCLQKAKAGITLAQQRDDKYYEGNFWNITGLVNSYQSHFDEAANAFNKELQIAEAIKNDELKGKAYANLGLMYMKQGNAEKSVEYSLKSAKMDEAAGNINRLPKNYANISNTFYNIGNKRKSKQYADSALIYYKRTNDISGMANVYNTLGALASDEKDYTISNRYYSLSLQYKKQVDDVSGMANTYTNIGDNYKDTKAWLQAKSYYDTALALYKKNEEQEGISRVLVNQANLLALMKDSAAALKNAEADTAITHLGSLQTKAEALYSLAVNAGHSGDYKKATAYYQQYFRLHDSLITQQTLDAVYETETKYQAEKKQRQIDLLNKDAVIRQLEVNKKNQWLLLSTTAFLLLLLSAYLYYRRFKIQKEQQLKDAVTEQQNLATKALFEGEQKERIRIARDLHDSIGQMLSVVKMQVSTLHASAKEDDKELTEASLHLVDKTITEVRSISHNLIPEELNFGLAAAIEELCHGMNRSGKTVVNFNYDKEGAELKLKKQTELSVYRIVQEILSNMAKHAEATQIDINIRAEENKILLQLKDNGKGFDTATIQQSKGIGWKNIMARVNLLNGNMQLQSDEITGMQIEITIPQ